MARLRGVRAHAGLGEGEGGQLLALRLGHQPALLLLLGPPLEERQAVEPDVDALDDAERGVGALELLAQEREADVVHPQAAVRPPGSGAPRNPSSPIFVNTSRWTSPPASQSRMWGRISASTKARAVSRTRRFSSVSEKSITGAGLWVATRWAAGNRTGAPPHPTPARPARRAAVRGVRRPRPYTPEVDTDTAPDALDLAALAGPNMSPVLGRYMDRSWSHGIGHRLYDTAGRAYLDFANGIAVTALGHAHPRVTAAIHAQVDRLIGPVHAIGFAEPTVRLAELLAGTFPDPLDTVLFLNSGSEAIDGALKLARRVTGRPGIIAFRGAFHGRTIGATSVTTSSLNYRTGYEPLLPGVYFAPYPAVYPEFDGDEDAATRSSLADPPVAARRRSSPRRRSPRS